MAKVKKKNKILIVPDTAVDRYLSMGFNEIGPNGEVKRKATGGFVIKPAKYNEALEEIDRLKAEVKKLKTELTKEKKKNQPKA